MKIPVKLIAIDLDDTLLKNDLTISQRTVDTLKKIKDKNIKVLIASGRSYEAMENYSKQIGLNNDDSFLITNNGSVIIKSNTKETIIEHFLPIPIAKEALDLVLELDLSCHIYEGKTNYILKHTKYSSSELNVSGLNPVKPDNYFDILEKPRYKMVLPGDPEKISKAEKIFKERFKDRANVFISKPYFLEVLPINACKGQALSEIAKILKMPQNKVMAFGDSMNDETMVRWAGEGVAMANANPKILEIAKHKTTFTNDEDGVADFLEKHVL